MRLILGAGERGRAYFRNFMVTDCLTKPLLSVIKSNVMVYYSTDQDKNKRIKTSK